MVSPTIAPSALPSLDPRKLVYDCGLTQEGLAAAVGVTYGHVRKWFCEARSPLPAHYRLAGEIKEKIERGEYEVRGGFLLPLRTKIEK